MVSLEFILNSLLHISFLATVLGCAFVFYISKVITKHFEKELKKNLKKVVKNFTSKLSQQQKDRIKLVLSNTNSEYTPFIANKINNKWLFSALFSIIGVLWVLFISNYLSLKTFTKINLSHLLIENLLIFAGIGMVEIYFFTNVVNKYVPVDSSYIPNKIIDTIYRRSKNSSNVDTVKDYLSTVNVDTIKNASDSVTPMVDTTQDNPIQNSPVEDTNYTALPSYQSFIQN